MKPAKEEVTDETCKEEVTVGDRAWQKVDFKKAGTNSSERQGSVKPYRQG
jgi:hypothetical protein